MTARSKRRLLRFVIENGPGLTLAEPPELVTELADGLERVVTLHG